MRDKDNDYARAPIARLPIVGMEETFLSFFPGDMGSTRVTFPGKSHIQAHLFLTAVRRAHNPNVRDRNTHSYNNQVWIEPEDTPNGLALHVTIEQRRRDAREESGPYSAFLEADVVEEIVAAIHIANVIQGHYARFEYEDVPDEEVVAPRDDTRVVPILLDGDDKSHANLAWQDDVIITIDEDQEQVEDALVREGKAQVIGDTAAAE